MLGGPAGIGHAAEAEPAPISLFSAAPAPAIFTESQLAFVQSWIREKVPECPAEVAAAVGTLFLAELKQQRPEMVDRLLAPDFPTRTFEPALLRLIGEQLTAGSQSVLRSEIARRRVQAVLALEPAAAATAARDAADLVTRLQGVSASSHRRLTEGRMDDEELQLQLRKLRQPKDAAASSAAPTKPRELTASDLVSEFTRANQAGNAALRLQALTVEGRVRTAAGEEQQLFVYKMRPNRVRLVVRQAGATIYVMAFDGSRFWQQVPGGPVQELTAAAVGQRRYLAEFLDPLFGEQNAVFDLREPIAGQAFTRIGVRRADGTSYVTRLDPATYRQIGRESDDGSIARYSDFRDVAGVTFAFHEEVADKDGHTGVFDVTRITPNPGLIQAFFDPAPAGRPDFFELEKIIGPAAKTP